MSMAFGGHLPHLGRDTTREGVRRFATSLEDWGYDSVWTSDHIAWPPVIESQYPYSPDGSFPGAGLGWLDPISTLTFVAACTERVQLGISVLILGYRPVVQTAKQIVTLDVLSEGRVVLGVGIGWMREEFEALQMPFDH